MNKTVAILAVILGFGSAATMYILGSNSSHIDELLDFYWMPLPIGVLGLFGLFMKKKPEQE